MSRFSPQSSVGEAGNYFHELRAIAAGDSTLKVISLFIKNNNVYQIN